LIRWTHSFEVFNKTAAEVAKEAVTSGLKEAGFSEVVVGVSAEMSQALAEQLLGPLLRVLLKMIDPTQKKLDSILEEPLQTGVSLTRQAMTMQVITAADAALRQQHFYNALSSLEKAYTYAAQQKHKRAEEMLHIRMTQAAIGKELGAEGALKLYLQEYLEQLKKHVGFLQGLKYFVQDDPSRRRFDGWPGKDYAIELMLSFITDAPGARERFRQQYPDAYKPESRKRFDYLAKERLADWTVLVPSYTFDRDFCEFVNKECDQRIHALLFVAKCWDPSMSLD
jgi:hypothetical protein